LYEILGDGNSIMLKTIEYSQIDNVKDNYILVDVRSPGEFTNATLPGAVNVYLFDDEQRKIIGTVYVQESVEKAKKLGMEAVSKNLPIIYDKINELQKKYKTLIFFCARGGMRSTALVALLSSLGVNALKLKGGYKGYRGYINKVLPKVIEEVNFIVIHGNTGTGKTEILKELSKKGYDVLDLEGAANHRGSLLGSVGLGKENSQKQFESLLYQSLKNRKSNLIFVEGESKRIGDIIIPEFIYSAMKKGKHINLKSNISFRVKNIIKDYVGGDNLELIEALNKLRKYINGEKIDRYIKEIKALNYESVAEELMIKYYDPMYENNQYNYDLELENCNIEETCNNITNSEICKFLNTDLVEDTSIIAGSHNTNNG
jgi:tRNA 2-selenouridine synthase